jgi:D-sedoheptulose 7-phosphate isomerase
LVFVRQFQALASKKDILITLTTSGKSENINNLLKYTKKNKIYSVLISGNKGGISKKYSTDKLIVSSKETARIQEIHLLILHSLAEDIENHLYFKV